MAKIQVYKFINPGVTSVKTPAVVAARQTILAQNRLGKTVEGVGNTVIDVDKLTNLRLGLIDKTEQAERRKKRRGKDQDAEEVTEKGLSGYFKKKGKDAKKFKPTLKTSSFFEKLFGWVGPLLSPFVVIATKIFQLQLMKDFLEWTKDDKNIEKLSLFLEKTSFVFQKIADFAKFLIVDNIIEGTNKLFGDDETLLGRLSGLGKIMTGIIGLKYLMNPFSIITDIIFLANIISATQFLGKRGQCLPGTGSLKNKTKNIRNNRVNNRRTISTNKVRGGQLNRGPLSGIREFFRKGKSKLFGNKSVTSGVGGTNTLNNITQRFKNIFKKRTPITQGGTVTPKGNFLSNLFKKKPPVTQSGATTQGNFLKNLFDKNTKANINASKGKVNVTSGATNATKTSGLIKSLRNIKITPGGVVKGVKGLGIGLVLDYSVNKVADEIITKPLNNYFDAKMREQVEEIINKQGIDKAIDLFQSKIDEENAKKPFPWWKNALTLGYGKIFAGPDKVVIEKNQRALDYANELKSKGIVGGSETIDKKGFLESKEVKLATESITGNLKFITGQTFAPEGKDAFSLIGNLFKKKTPTVENKNTVPAGSFNITKKEEPKKGNFFTNLFKRKTVEPAKKKKGLFGLGFLGLEKGGELPQMFLGGLIRAITRPVVSVVKSVVNVVSDVAETAWNTVSSVASNPIVSTVASFIPGANIIVPAINAVNALSSGNLAGAAMSALGSIGNLANINTVNAINQPSWVQNLRFSKFGEGITNMYYGAINAFDNISQNLSNMFDTVRNSTMGKIGMKIYNGNIGGAIGEVVGMMPGLSGGIESFGKFLEENKLQGILGAVPGIGGLASKVPNILSIPGMESILGRPGEGFSATGALGNVADKVGMRGVYQAILSGAQSGNYIEGLPELAAEIGVDPRILGVLDKGKQLMQNNQFNAEYALQTAIEFIPVPLVVEKIVAAPTPVPINSGDTYIVAPSSTNGARR